MRILTITIILGVIWGVSCSPKKQHQDEVLIDPDYELSEISKAQQNIETVCYVCHSPSASPDDRLAPPLEIAKRNYLAQTKTKDEFVNKMVLFILNPTAEQSMLHSDVEQYGIMDPVGFSEEDVQAMAEYIYDTKLEKPSWLKDQ